MLKCECFTLTLPKHPSPEALRTHPEEEPPPGIYTSSSAGCFVFISTVGPFQLGGSYSLDKQMFAKGPGTGGGMFVRIVVKVVR